MAGKAIVWILASSLSSLLYWIGGRSWGNKAVRRFGCPLIVYGYLWWLRPDLGLKGAILTILTYILTALALSTYHDYLAPDKSSENWLCWLVTGFVYGLAAFLFIWSGIPWLLILIRAIVLGIATMVWSETFGNVHIEESGRGFFITATVPLLLI